MTDHAREMDLDPGRLVIPAPQPQVGRLLSFPLQLSDRTLVAPGQHVEPGQALIERFRAVASRTDLTRAGWPRQAPGRNALDVHVLRLRRRLEPVGLEIRTVRSRGYMLEAAV